MAKEIFNRQELKFVIYHEQYERMLSTIHDYMQYDNHNSEGQAYSIYNLYVDTPDCALIRHSMDKPTIYKEKLRIRSYKPLNSDSEVFFEVKKRYKKITNKRRTKIILSDALEFIETGIPPAPQGYMNIQVVKEFSAILQQRQYQPKVYISYDRVAFFAKDDVCDLRITFDTNLLSQTYNENTQHRLLDEDKLVMEVKSTVNIPLWLVELLDTNNVRKRSFSKYGTEYAHELNQYTNQRRSQYA